MRTSREFQLALAKLLNRVRINNSWSKNSFKEASTHVVGVSKSEAYRFYKALIEMDQLRIISNKRVVPNFDVLIWKNEDKKLGLIREILDIFPIEQHRGRVKGKVYPAKSEVTIIAEADMNPLSRFSAQDLVKELRNRGYEVEAKRNVITVEVL